MRRKPPFSHVASAKISKIERHLPYAAKDLRMITKEELSAKRLLVVGDSMLDRYWFGDTNRISPEAPVPVVRIVKEENRLGGAANVALNIACLGARVSLMSVIGRDDAGHALRDLLDKAGIEGLLQEDTSVRTTVKLREIGRAHV